MADYIATYLNKYPCVFSALTLKEAKLQAKKYTDKGDKLISVRKQKELNYIADVMMVQDEDGTVIPLKGRFDGTFFSGTQFEGLHFNMDTNMSALKFLEKKKKRTITITLEITDVTSKRYKSWNMNIKEER